MAQSNFLCSTDSLLKGESLAGTAGQGMVWLLLEYEDTWENQAWQSSHLPAPVKEKLETFLANIPQARVLLIRSRPQRLGRTVYVIKSSEFLVYVALARAAQPLLYEFKLHTYNDLLELNLAEIAAASSQYEHALTDKKLFLICTHGRRDRCCARFGAELYDHLTAAPELPDEGGAIWQASHVGGHRFAANLLCFPHALFYGRVDRSDAREIIHSYLDGMFSVAKARGRACYPRQAQAAEIYLRQAAGLMHVEAPTLEEMHLLEPGVWQVIFLGKQDTYYAVRIAERLEETQVYTNCDSSEQTPLVTYTLVDIAEYH